MFFCFFSKKMIYRYNKLLGFRRVYIYNLLDVNRLFVSFSTSSIMTRCFRFVFRSGFLSSSFYRFLSSAGCVHTTQCKHLYFPVSLVSVFNSSSDFLHRFLSIYLHRNCIIRVVFLYTKSYRLVKTKGESFFPYYLYFTIFLDNSYFFL